MLNTISNDDSLKVTRITNSFFNSNTYILSNSVYNYVWLVDCGDYFDVKERLSGKCIKGVILTHSHADHIYGLNELLRDYPDAIIYTNDFGILALQDPKLNITKYHEEMCDFIISKVDKIFPLIEGDSIELFPHIIANVLSTPGHDKSCLSYIVGDYLFTGDSFIPNAKLTAIFPNSNKSEARNSYDRLKAMEGLYSICPGHGEIKVRNYTDDFIR